ncbi:MAG TPA: potassium channel family protein [Pyrinomonadaceae bacterium]|nr:potassium channel family protein [Pyrinomonadaceae bacterium]
MPSSSNLSPLAFLLSPHPWTALGVAVIALVAYDVYATILHARGRGGPVSETLNRGVWRAARLFASRLPRQRRHRALNVAGPLLMPGLIVVYLLLLTAGFGLVYYPRMPAQFVLAAEAEGGAWLWSLYFSGITLTTVGYGDIMPRTTAMRFTALAEGASGFALISLSVTYLITVYRALEHKRAVALSFYHQAEEGADVAGFISHHFVSGRFYGLETALRSATRDTQRLLESHIEHPIIHFFHPVEIHKSMPRMVFILLETCAVLRSCLDEDEYPETVRHPEVRTLEASTRHVLAELAGVLRLERVGGARPETVSEDSRRWSRRYRRTLRQLKSEGVKTRRDEAEGFEVYRARREEWDTRLRLFADFLGYDWDEITGDRDLRYAADDEMEIPEKQ